MSAYRNHFYSASSWAEGDSFEGSPKPSALLTPISIASSADSGLFPARRQPIGIKSASGFSDFDEDAEMNEIFEAKQLTCHFSTPKSRIGNSAGSSTDPLLKRRLLFPNNNNQNSFRKALDGLEESVEQLKAKVKQNFSLNSDIIDNIESYYEPRSTQNQQSTEITEERNLRSRYNPNNVTVVVHRMEIDQNRLLSPRKLRPRKNKDEPLVKQPKTVDRPKTRVSKTRSSSRKATKTSRKETKTPRPSITAVSKIRTSLGSTKSEISRKPTSKFQSKATKKIKISSSESPKASPTLRKKQLQTKQQKETASSESKPRPKKAVKKSPVAKNKQTQRKTKKEVTSPSSSKEPAKSNESSSSKTVETRTRKSAETKTVNGKKTAAVKSTSKSKPKKRNRGDHFQNISLIPKSGSFH